MRQSNSRRNGFPYDENFLADGLITIATSRSSERSIGQEYQSLYEVSAPDIFTQKPLETRFLRLMLEFMLPACTPVTLFAGLAQGASLPQDAVTKE